MTDGVQNVVMSPNNQAVLVAWSKGHLLTSHSGCQEHNAHDPVLTAVFLVVFDSPT